MNFGQALEALKQGKRVARAGWNGKGMWLALVSVWRAPLLSFVDNEHPVGLTPWIGLKTATNTFNPWQPSQSDMLSQDWEEVA